jgi:predicted LPLAT superfamily acyltransferase
MTGATPPVGWARLAERGSMWGMRLTSWCFRTFGRRISSPLVHAVVGYFFLTDRRGRRASLAYLNRIYRRDGGATRAKPPTLWDSFLHYREFALAIVDRLAIWFGRTDEFDFELRGTEVVDRLAEDGRGALLIGAHLGSFDALRLIARRKRFVVNVLMFTAHADRINTIFRELSPDVDARVIQVAPGSIGPVFEVRRCLERGELVAVLADRMEPGDQDRSSRVPLLGSPVDLPQAPFLLAQLLGYPALLILAMREGPGRYTVFAEQLAEGVALPRARAEREKAVGELLTAYAQRLEHYIERYPLQWFNFYDYWGDEDSRGS